MTIQSRGLPPNNISNVMEGRGSAYCFRYANLNRNLRNWHETERKREKEGVKLEREEEIEIDRRSTLLIDTPLVSGI